MHLPEWTRTALAVATVSPLLLGSAGAMASEDSLDVAMLIPGEIDDNGFMEAGYEGLLQIESELGATITYRDRVPPESQALEQALAALAAEGPDLIIAHGGQNAEAVLAVADDYPEVQFSVTQGGVTADNVSSYEVLQEESAWLAGAAAGLMTESNVVGHISGIRVTPGLKGRGGFYHGLMHTNPEAEFLTIFAGDQDDIELARRVTDAEAEAGADLIFTMLNAGRQGAIEAMQARDDVHQFGNVREWHEEYPDVFVGSAVADVSMAGFLAAKAMQDGSWQAGEIVSIGLENPEAVRLSLAPSVSAEVRERIETLTEEIVAGRIEVQTGYEGAEFVVE